MVHAKVTCFLGRGISFLNWHAQVFFSYQVDGFRHLDSESTHWIYIMPDHLGTGSLIMQDILSELLHTTDIYILIAQRVILVANESDVFFKNLVTEREYPPTTDSMIGMKLQHR